MAGRYSPDVMPLYGVKCINHIIVADEVLDYEESIVVVEADSEEEADGGEVRDWRADFVSKRRRRDRRVGVPRDRRSDLRVGGAADTPGRGVFEAAHISL